MATIIVLAAVALAAALAARHIWREKKKGGCSACGGGCGCDGCGTRHAHGG